MKYILMGVLIFIGTKASADSRDPSKCSTMSVDGLVTDPHYDTIPESAKYHYVIKREFEDGTVTYLGIDSLSSNLSDDQIKKMMKSYRENRKDKVDPIPVYVPKDENDHSFRDQDKFLFSACKNWSTGQNPGLSPSGAVSR